MQADWYQQLFLMKLLSNRLITDEQGCAEAQVEDILRIGRTNIS